MAKTKPQLAADTKQTLKPDAEPDKAVEQNPKPAESMSQAESEQLDEEEKEFHALRRDLPGVKGASAAGIVAISVGGGVERRFIAMKRRKTRLKTKTRRKSKKRKSEAVAKRKAKIIAVLAPKQAGHTPEATAENKRALIKALSIGMGPGEAAEAIGIGRSTAFNWKQEDPAFSAKWEEARETAWDKLEGRLYDIGMAGEVKAITDTLKARRPETWRETRSEPTLTTVKMTLEESKERLRQLGIELPRFEGDQVEDHTVPLEDHATGRTEDDP